MFRRKPPAWVLKVTTPDGTVLEISTAHAEALWRAGPRTNDGYLELPMALPRVRFWVKPEGWTEPEGRIDQLEGSGALPDGMRRWR